MTDTINKPKLSPDDRLAVAITDAIMAANVISDQKISQVRQGLAKGTLMATDWKLLAELALPSEEGNLS